MTRTANVAFRTDASLDIGTGHVMRCLTLAKEIERHGGSAIFLCREHKGHLIEHIQNQNFDVLPLKVGQVDSRVGDKLVHANWLGATQEEDAMVCRAALKGTELDLIVVDHYGLDAVWQHALGDMAQQVMAIDDIADRRHDCDMLLDQNLGRQDAHYKTLVPSHCKVLTGPRYALLRPEFAKWRDFSLQRRENLSEVRSLLLNLGGVDKENLTTVILAALENCNLPPACRITVVMGGSAPGLSEVTAKAAGMGWKTEVLVNVDNMAELMAHADLAIGAAGTTSWERCCLGLPTILMVLAGNQRMLAENLCKAGAGIMIEKKTSIATQLSSQVEELMDVGRLALMAGHAAAVTDGQGTARVWENLGLS